MLCFVSNPSVLFSWATAYNADPDHDNDGDGDDGGDGVMVMPPWTWTQLRTKMIWKDHISYT